MENEPPRRISKPIGVYVLTILIFIRLGLFQFINYWVEIQRSDGDVPFSIVFISLFLSVFTAAAAIWAFYGDNLARIAILVFVSLNVLWWFFLIVSAIAYNDSETFGWLKFLPTLIQPVFCLCITWWFFNKKDVVAFYKQQSQI